MLNRAAHSPRHNKFKNNKLDGFLLENYSRERTFKKVGINKHSLH